MVVFALLIVAEILPFFIYQYITEPSHMRRKERGILRNKLAKSEPGGELE